MNPKISVVIPVYNGSPFLGEAIQSALDQHHPPHEIIVIDDGSTDDTPKIIENFKDKVITRRLKNSGVANAMNIGMGLATGDYIAFLDHDDVWFKDKLKQQLEAFLQYPEVGFSCCNFATRPTGLNRRLVRHYFKLVSLKGFNFNPPLMRDPVRRLFQENFVGTSSVAVVKKELARRVGLFNTKYRICGDYDFWLRCALVTDFVVLPEMLLYKRSHSTNISSNQIKTISEHRQVLYDFVLNQKEYLTNKGILGFCQFELAKRNYHLGNLHFGSGNRKQAFYFYFQGLRAYPKPKNMALLMMIVFKKLVQLMAFNAFKGNKEKNNFGTVSR